MAKRIADLPKHDRPREKMQRKGAAALTDVELVAILLGFGIKGHDVMTVAKRIVRMVDAHHGRPDLDDLQRLEGVGPAKATLIAAALEFARRRIRPEGIKIETPVDVLPLGSALRRPQAGTFSLHFPERRQRGHHHPCRLRRPGQQDPGPSARGLCRTYNRPGFSGYPCP